MAKFATLFAAFGALLTSVVAVNPVDVKQQEFVDSKTGKRFVLLGVDYQPGGQGAYGEDNKQDPLSDPDRCLRDAALMQSLGVNTIRSYNVDPTLNHDLCASIFNAVGIYMVIDVNSPLAGQSIDRSQPTNTYTTSYLQHIFSVVEAFKSYPNTLGFFAGNEIINDVPSSEKNPPVIRAVQRDLKNYIAAHADRTIPVGYSAADVRDVLQDTWAYLQCDNGDGGKSRSDFFGLNSYSWCGSSSSFQTAGYDVLVSMFSSTTIPVFFSEYGCNKPSPRVFDEVPSLYGKEMTVFSGGLVYEWTQEDSNYGLIDNNNDGSAKLRQDYNALAGQYKKIDINLLSTTNDTATSLQAPKCDKSLITSSDFSTDFNIPSPPKGADALIKNGVQNPPVGKIVQVTDVNVKSKVYDSNGKEITGLKITPGDQANTPGKSGTTSSKAAAAPTNMPSLGGSALAAAGVMGFAALIL